MDHQAYRENRVMQMQLWQINVILIPSFLSPKCLLWWVHINKSTFILLQLNVRTQWECGSKVTSMFLLIACSTSLSRILIELKVLEWVGKNISHNWKINQSNLWLWAVTCTLIFSWQSSEIFTMLTRKTLNISISYVCVRESLHTQIFAFLIYHSHAVAGQNPTFCKHDKHRLLDEGRNEKWVEVPVKYLS